MNFKKLFAYVLLASIGYSSNAEFVEIVKIEGDELVSPEALSSLMTISVGQDIDSQDIKKQISALYASGYFSQVHLTLENGVLTILLTEQPVVRSINSNSKLIDEDNIRKQLENAGVIKGELLNESLLETWRLSTELSLKQAGYIHAKVDADIKMDSGVADIHIKVIEGAGTKLKAIHFEGDIKYPERILSKVISSRETGLLSFIMNDDLYSRQQIEMDKMRLIKYYQSHGYKTPKVDVKVADITPVQRIWSSNYKTVTFVVDAGELFTLNEIQFSEEQSPWPPELKEQITSKISGSVASSEIMEGIKVLVHQFYQDDEYGQFYGAVATEKGFSRNKIDLELKLIKDVSFVRFIHITGNTSTLDEPLRRALSVQESKPFNREMIRFSEYALHKSKVYQICFD